MFDDHERLESASSLRRKAVGGVAWLGAGRVIAQLLSLATKIVLAKLLPPELFGQVAMAMVITVFLDLLTGHGVAIAVIQAPEMDDEKLSTAFWASIGQGLVLAGLAFLGAPLIGAFFHEPEIVPVIQVLVGGAALLSPSMVFEALFVRNMNFRNVTLRRVISQLVAAVLAMGLAWSGAGVWSLVVQRLVASLLFFAMAVASSPWMPRFIFSWTAARELSRVSAGSSFSAIVGALTRQVPNLAIGRFLGAEQLGYYTLAQQVLTLPVQYVAGPISGVLFSLLSRLQGQPDEFRNTYERGQRIIVVVAAVLPALVAVSAPQAVPAVLGVQWVPAVPLLQILSVPATMGLATAMIGAAIRSLGQPRTLILVTVVPIAMQVVGLLIGLHEWQLVGAALGWALGAVLGFAYALLMAAVVLHVPIGRQLRPLWVALPPLVALLGVAKGAFLVLSGIPVLGALMIGCTLGVAAYAAVLRLTAPAEWQWLAQRARGMVRLASRRKAAA